MLSNEDQVTMLQELILTLYTENQSVLSFVCTNIESKLLKNIHVVLISLNTKKIKIVCLLYDLFEGGSGDFRLFYWLYSRV